MATNLYKNKLNYRETYNHGQYETQRNILRFLLKYLGFNILAKIHSVKGLENFPKEGPALIMINHIAYVDPIVVLNVAPRNIVPLAKVEVLKIPVAGIFPRIWHVIPVQREDVDRKTVRSVFNVLEAGEIVLVAPEGTRSPQLRQGKEGIAYLASRSGVPILPVAIDGTEGFPALRFSAAWKTPGADVRFGKPFRFHSELRNAAREQLRLMTDEAMYILSAMLPENRRGYYSDLSRATQDTIEYS